MIELRPPGPDCRKGQRSESFCLFLIYQKASDLFVVRFNDSVNEEIWLQFVVRVRPCD